MHRKNGSRAFRWAIGVSIMFVAVVLVSVYSRSSSDGGAQKVNLQALALNIGDGAFAKATSSATDVLIRQFIYGSRTAR